MRKCLIFCHGWGGKINFWDNLKLKLNDVIKAKHLDLVTYFLDLGYFHNPINFNYMHFMHEPLEFIGVGHSLGLIKLLQLDIKFKAIIGLQSFISFIGKDLSLRILRKRQLNRLIKKFSIDPVATLNYFYNMINANFKIDQAVTLDVAKLTQDLNLLKIDLDLPLNLPGLIIGAQDDKIVPPNLILDNFIDYPLVNIKILPEGSHGVGHTNSDLICQDLIKFIYELN